MGRVTVGARVGEPPCVGEEGLIILLKRVGNLNNLHFLGGNEEGEEG